MTDGDMERISSLKKQGKSAAAIAETLGLPLNTVKSYLRRHPGTEDAHICLQCGKVVTQNNSFERYFFYIFIQTKKIVLNFSCFIT